jgi:hypothetical protein
MLSTDIYLKTWTKACGVSLYLLRSFLPFVVSIVLPSVCPIINLCFPLYLLYVVECANVRVLSVGNMVLLSAIFAYILLGCLGTACCRAGRNNYYVEEMQPGLFRAIVSGFRALL